MEIQETKEVLGITIRKEGYYYCFGGYQKDVPDGHTLIKGILYENPEVVLNYQSDFTRIKVFDTCEKAEKYYNNINFKQ